MKVGTSLQSLHTHIKRKLRGYYKLYANKFDKLDEMNQCLKRHKLPTFTQEDNLNIPKKVLNCSLKLPQRKQQTNISQECRYKKSLIKF